MYIIALDKRKAMQVVLKGNFKSELIMNISCTPRVFDTQSQDNIAAIFFKNNLIFMNIPWFKLCLFNRIKISQDVSFKTPPL